MTRRHQPTARIVTAFTKIPEPLTPGRIRCICGRVVRLTKTGHPWAHHMPNGDPCAHHTTYQPHPNLDTIPDVTYRAPRGHAPTVAQSADPTQSRIYAGSTCVDCGRWLPGERSLCGRCGARRERERPR